MQRVIILLALCSQDILCSHHPQLLCGSSVTEGCEVRVLFPGTWKLLGIPVLWPWPSSPGTLL